MVKSRTKENDVGDPTMYKKLNHLNRMGWVLLGT